MCVTTIIPLSIRIFLHDLHKPRDVYACYRVIFVFAFIIGLIPFQFSSQPHRHLKNTILGYLNILARIIFYGYVFFYSMSNEQSLLAYFNFSEVSKFTDSLQKFNGMFAIIIVLIFGVVERNSLINLTEQYEILELHFSRVSVQFNQKKCAFNINLVLLLMFLANLLFIVYGHFVVFKHNGINLSWIAISSFYSPHMIISSVVVIFYAILYKITLYFKAVNEVIILKSFFIYIESNL